MYNYKQHKFAMTVSYFIWMPGNIKSAS